MNWLMIGVLVLLTAAVASAELGYCTGAFRSLAVVLMALLVIDRIMDKRQK